jgi:hypothetical protein
MQPSEKWAAWLVASLSFTVAIAFGWYFGWPWAILGAWVGFLIAFLPSQVRLGIYALGLLQSMFMITTCGIGPVEVFLIASSPVRWVGLIWLIFSLFLLGFLGAFSPSQKKKHQLGGGGEETK